MHCSGGHHLVKEEGGVTVDPRVATAAWGLFEVAEYHFLTLACYSAMITMLTFFIWTKPPRSSTCTATPISFVFLLFCFRHLAEIHCNTTLWQKLQLMQRRDDR
jgi:hypothetical protein